MHRIAALGLAALLFTGLTGCAAVDTVTHVRGVAAATADLASATLREPGVEQASARYVPLDGAGESVWVLVTMRPRATVAEWSAVTQSIRRALTGATLRPARQIVRIRGSDADLRFGDATDWPGAHALGGWMSQWDRLRRATGAALQLVHSAKSGSSYGYFAATAADSTRFIAHAAAIGPMLRGRFVEGAGFSGSGPAPKGVAALYRALLRSHAPIAANASALPARPSAQLVWGPSSVNIVIAVPRSQSRPSVADARLIAALGQRIRIRGAKAASWTDGAQVASAGLTRCTTGKRTVEAPDERLAAALAAIGRPLRAPAGPGVCSA